MSSEFFFDVVHVTTAHPRGDSRIYHKMCRSVSRRGWRTALCVADGQGDQTVGGVEIFDIGQQRGRLRRMTLSVLAMAVFCAGIRARIFHLHDPELHLVGIALRLLGRQVVFDAHEDLPKQVASKTYLPTTIRRIAGGCASSLEWLCMRWYPAVIAATPLIQRRLKQYNPNTEVVCNYPILSHEAFMPPQFSAGERPAYVCYVGGITENRGLLELIDALAILEGRVELLLAGQFASEDFRMKAINRHGWRYVTELGYLSRDEVRECMAKAFAGIVTLHPTLNYVESLPIKLFEYMSEGLPVVASDFPLWRDLLRDWDCAVFVDPRDPVEIAYVLATLQDNPKESIKKGLRGRDAILDKFNWESEAQKLFKLYEALQ